MIQKNSAEAVENTLQKKTVGNRKVADRKKVTYTLTEKLAGGGQGIVCKTDIHGDPKVLVKILTEKNPQKCKKWNKHIQWLMRQDLDDLKIARPLEIIAKPVGVNGYVMELMDGLLPLEEILKDSFYELAENKTESLEGYRKTGGLKRRLMLLKELATTLSKLHARGLAYGDISPRNIFVSESVENHQLWLIDSDNICVSERAGHEHIHTPGYAAPEIIRGESGVNMSTDCWSFAVIAMELLTHAHPFESGCAVEDEDPDIAINKAANGELPWIYDMEDDSNSWTGSGLSIEIVVTKQLRQLLDKCFSTGRNILWERPSMNAWADALDAACALLHNCHKNDCGMSFLYDERNNRQQCPFCDYMQPEQASVLMKHFYCNDSPKPGESRWIHTPDRQLLNLNEKVVFHVGAIGTELYRESPALAEAELKEDGLYLAPTTVGSIHIQRESDGIIFAVIRKQRLNTTSRKGETFALHLRHQNVEGYFSHPVWKFHW